MLSFSKIYRSSYKLKLFNHHQLLVFQQHSFSKKVDDFICKIYSNKITSPKVKGKKSIKPNTISEGHTIFTADKPRRVVPAPSPVGGAFTRDYFDKEKFLEFRSEETHSLRTGKINTEDKSVDNLVKLTVRNSLEEALVVVKKYSLLKRYPSSKTLTMLASISGRSGSIESLKQVQETLQEAFPKVFESQMEYQHYYAEALHKSGEIKKSIEIFEELFIKFPTKTKKFKTCNMYKFLAIDIIEKNRIEELDFLMGSALKIAKTGIVFPIGIVWLQLFLSKSERMNNATWYIIESCPETKVYIIRKIDNILELSRKEQRIDTLQRLLETVLKLQLESEYSKVCTELMTLQYSQNKMAAAFNTRFYMQEQDIKLTMSKSLSDLISFQSNQKKRRRPTPIVHSESPLVI